MSSLFGRWFGYGLGASIGKAIYGEDPPAARPPIRPKTEEEILADEKRFAEDERRIEAESPKGHGR